MNRKRVKSLVAVRRKVNSVVGKPKVPITPFKPFPKFILQFDKIIAPFSSDPSSESGQNMFVVTQPNVEMAECPQFLLRLQESWTTDDVNSVKKAPVVLDKVKALIEGINLRKLSAGIANMSTMDKIQMPPNMTFTSFIPSFVVKKSLRFPQKAVPQKAIMSTTNHLFVRSEKVRKITIDYFWLFCNQSAVSGHMISLQLMIRQMLRVCTTFQELDCILDCIKWMNRNVQAMSQNLMKTKTTFLDLKLEIDEMMRFQMGGTIIMKEANIMYNKSCEILDTLSSINQWIKNDLALFEGKKGAEILPDIIILYMSKKYFLDLVERFIKNQKLGLRWSEKKMGPEIYDMQVSENGTLLVNQKLLLTLESMKTVLSKAQTELQFAQDNAFLFG